MLERQQQQQQQQQARTCIYCAETTILVAQLLPVLPGINIAMLPTATKKYKISV